MAILCGLTQELERGTGLAEVDQPPLLPDRSPQTDSSDCKSQVDGNSGTMEKATLVLDLDETLIHSVVDPVSNETTTHQRPGLSHFLQQVASMFEVVVFTAGLEDYASPIIDSLDPQGLIQHRLFRQHVRCIRGTHLIKDLASLNRPLARVVIVDNSAESFLLQPLNAIPIEPYLGEAQDTRLFELLPLLQALASAPDVRQLLAVCHAACDFTCVPAQLPGRTKLTGSLTPGKQGTVAAPDSSCASPCPCATPSASMPSQVSPVASQPHACSHSPACTALPTGEQSPEVVHEDAARLCQGRADMRAARAAGSSPWLQYARAPRGSAGNTSVRSLLPSEMCTCVSVALAQVLSACAMAQRYARASGTVACSLREREFIDNQQVTESRKYNALSGNTASGHSRPSIWQR
jgi:Dullard-like phosphatase family protein